MELIGNNNVEAFDIIDVQEDEEGKRQGQDNEAYTVSIDDQYQGHKTTGVH